MYFSGTGVTAWKIGIKEYEELFKSVIGTLCPKGYETFKGMGWYVFCSVEGFDGSNTIGIV